MIKGSQWPKTVILVLFWLQPRIFHKFLKFCLQIMSKITYYVKKLALKPFWITEDGKANVTNPLHSGCYWWLHVICSGDPIPREQIRSLALSEGGLLCNEYRRVLWLGFLQIEHNESTRECDITEFRDYSQVSVCCVYVHYSSLCVWPVFAFNLLYVSMFFQFKIVS